MTTGFTWDDYVASLVELDSGSTAAAS